MLLLSSLLFLLSSLLFLLSSLLFLLSSLLFLLSLIESVLSFIFSLIFDCNVISSDLFLFIKITGTTIATTITPVIPITINVKKKV